MFQAVAYSLHNTENAEGEILLLIGYFEVIYP